MDVTSLFSPHPWFHSSSSSSSPTCSQRSDSFSKEIRDFVQFLRLTATERYQRVHVINEVQALVNVLWGPMQVDVYGSWQTDLCLPCSDVDLSIQQLPSAAVISELMTAMVSCRYYSCKFLEHAKVPIVKFTHLSTGIQGDISFCNSKAAVSAQLVLNFQHSFPACRPLIIFLKAFLKSADLNNVYTGGLSSYAITLIVVAFLQMHPYYKDETLRNRYALSDLFTDLLAFYGKDFNYHSTTISLLDGGKYFPKKPRWEDPLRPHLLSIIDPLDSNNDVGRGCFAISQVRSLFFAAYTQLQNAKNSSSSSSSSPSSRISLLIDVRNLIQFKVISFDRCFQQKLDRHALSNVTGIPTADSSIALAPDSIVSLLHAAASLSLSHPTSTKVATCRSLDMKTLARVKRMEKFADRKNINSCPQDDDDVCSATKEYSSILEGKSSSHSVVSSCDVLPNQITSTITAAVEDCEKDSRYDEGGGALGRVASESNVTSGNLSTRSSVFSFTSSATTKTSSPCLSSSSFATKSLSSLSTADYDSTKTTDNDEDDDNEWRTKSFVEIGRQQPAHQQPQPKICKKKSHKPEHRRREKKSNHSSSADITNSLRIDVVNSVSHVKKRKEIPKQNIWKRIIVELP